MAKRRPTSPSLYELIKTRPTEADDAPPRRSPAPRDDGPGSRSWLSPGQVVSMPVGYMLVTVALVVSLLLLAYMIGYKRARNSLRAWYEQQLLDQVEALGNPEQRPSDPLVERDRTETPSWSIPGGREDRAETTTPPGQWGTVESDPRTGGMKYFVLMETHQAGAERLAAYCRDHGLETYVVVSHNNRARRLVITLPGFAGTTPLQDPAVQDLRGRIHAIGRRWKLDERGATDLHDAYPLLYEP